MGLTLTGVAGSVVSTATAQYSRMQEAVAYVERMGRKAETLLDETTDAVRAARPVIDAMAEAVDAGMLDDARATVNQLQRTALLVDRTTKAVQSTVPGVAGLRSTHEEVRMAREAMEHLAGILNTAVSQLESLPGAALVRRRIVHDPAGDLGSHSLTR